MPHNALLILFVLVIIGGLTRGVGKQPSRFKQVARSRLMRIFPWQPSLFRSTHEYFDRGYTNINKPLGEPFQVSWWAREYFILPPKYLPDLKKADSRSLNFFKNLSDAFSLHSSVGDLYSTNVMVDVVKKKLNPILPRLIPLIAEECDYALEREIGLVTTEFKAAHLFDKVMLRVTSRILASEELCRQEEFLQKSLEFSQSIFTNGLLISMVPLGPFRELGAWVLSYPHRRKLESLLQLVIPVVQERLSKRESPEYTPPQDSIEWTIELSASLPHWNSPRSIALQVVQNLWAGASAPAGLLTRMVFQVLAEPQYFEPLYQECQRATSTFGWSEKALNNMKLLDSFIRELNRLYPTGSITCARTVMDKSFTFHDGLTLPAGARIGIPAMAIQRDAENFTDPMVFDGFRFARLQGSAELTNELSEQSWAAATVSPTNLAFGYGKHACTGRFYAIRKVKIIFSKLLLYYEFKWTSPTTQRPPDLSINGQFAPNLEKLISIMPRKERFHKAE